MGFDTRAVELFYDTGSGMVRILLDTLKNGETIEISSDLEYERAG